MRGKNQWIIVHSVILFFCLNLFVLSPQTLLAQNQPEQVPVPVEEQIFQDIVLDFAIYEYLLHDTLFDGTKLLALHASSIEEAVEFLSVGFSQSLAELIAGYYLVECSPTDIQVLTMDSIPIITPKDKAQTQINLITNSKACVSCRFYNCYEWGDEYLYSVMVKKQASRWIIDDLMLQSIKPD